MPLRNRIIDSDSNSDVSDIENDSKSEHSVVDIVELDKKTKVKQDPEIIELTTNSYMAKPKKKRLRRGKEIIKISESSSFQKTKRSNPDHNSFKDYAFNNGSKVKRLGRRKRLKTELDSEDELSELNTDETTSDESGVDSDEQFLESDDDEVEKLFERCEEISSRLQGIVDSLNEEKIKHKENNAFVTKQEADALFKSPLSLKEYQLVGLNWIHFLYKEKVNGILADESKLFYNLFLFLVGLGKTIQSIAIIALLKARYNINGMHLIVAPGSTLENWRRELKKWLPDFKALVYHGSQETRTGIRRKVRKNPNEVNILLTTYTYFERESSSDDRTFLYNRNFEYVIYDEAHAIKNLMSQRYKRLILLKSKHRLLLSGTPIQNNLNELLATMSFAMPKVFKADSKQLTEFFKTERKDKDIKRLKKALKPFILRRIKVDVLNQLAKKKEEVQVLELCPKQKEIYDTAITNYKHKVKNKMITTDTENIFSYLRKACNHPLLVQNIFGKNENGIDRRITKLVGMFHDVGAFGQAATKTMIKNEIKNYSDWQLHLLCKEFSNSKKFDELCLPLESLWTSTKCKHLSELLKTLSDNGHRSVLFSQWTTLLDILEELLQQMNIKYVRFDGQTAISERQDIVDKFNNSKDIEIFLLSTRAGGLGINLTSADTVIIHDLDFNPTVDQQATDRVHRIGQTKPVTVYKLISKGTVDEHIYNLQKRKMELDEKLFEKGKVKKSSKLTKKDINSILKNLTFA